MNPRASFHIDLGDPPSERDYAAARIADRLRERNRRWRVAGFWAFSIIIALPIMIVLAAILAVAIGAPNLAPQLGMLGGIIAFVATERIFNPWDR